MVDEIVAHGKRYTFSTGESVIEIGTTVSFIPLITHGTLKVIRVDEEGNELLLYYLKAGQSCAMTLSSCLKNGYSTVRAIALETTEVITVPSKLVASFMLKYPVWSDFVVDTYARRFDEILTVLDQVAFHNLDTRLLQYLKEKSSIEGSKELHLSRAAIARDLNSSREVISRLLKQMEQKGLIKSSGGLITVV